MVCGKEAQLPVAPETAVNKAAQPPAKVRTPALYPPCRHCFFQSLCAFTISSFAPGPAELVGLMASSWGEHRNSDVRGFPGGSLRLKRLDKFNQAAADLT